MLTCQYTYPHRCHIRKLLSTRMPCQSKLPPHQFKTGVEQTRWNLWRAVMRSLAPVSRVPPIRLQRLLKAVSPSRGVHPPANRRIPVPPTPSAPSGWVSNSTPSNSHDLISFTQKIIPHLPRTHGTKSSLLWTSRIKNQSPSNVSSLSA